MRTGLGWGVLIAGVAGLGIWGAYDHARDMEAKIADSAAKIVSGSVHAVRAKVSGRDILVEGVVDSPQERGFLLSALNDVPGRRVVTENLTVLAPQSPFVTRLEKDTSGVRFSGYAPSEAARDALSGAEALDLASGADETWLEAMRAGQGAVSVLEIGTAALSDTALSLTGVAETIREQTRALEVLGSLPEQIALTTDIAVRLDETAVREAIRQAAETLVADAPHKIDVSVSDRGVTLTGPVNGAEEQTRLLTAVGDLRYVEEVSGGLTILPRLDPFVTGGQLDGDTKRVTLRGHVPSEADREATGADRGSADLALGAPDDWTDLTRIATQALGELAEGDWTLEGRSLTLTGGALSSAARDAALTRLAALPDGVLGTVEIALLDDGKPASFSLEYAADGGARLSGKLPFGMSMADVIAASGLDYVAGAPKSVPEDDGKAAAATKAIKTFAPWLGQFEKAALRFDANGQPSVTGVVSPGADRFEVTANLQRAFGRNAVEIRRARVPDLPPDETVRYNAALRQDERFAGGYWLPVIDPFTPTPRVCKERSDAVMRAVTVTFVTGEATLSTTSLNALGRMASVIRRCVTEGGLQAVVGGHTDNVGDETNNLTLSQARADAVREALILRGIPAGAIQAVGYGETQPVADNATEDGRAANRRTTVEWVAGN